MSRVLVIEGCDKCMKYFTGKPELEDNIKISLKEIRC